MGVNRAGLLRPKVTTKTRVGDPNCLATSHEVHELFVKLMLNSTIISNFPKNQGTLQLHEEPLHVFLVSRKPTASNQLKRKKCHPCIAQGCPWLACALLLCGEKSCLANILHHSSWLLALVESKAHLGDKSFR